MLCWIVIQRCIDARMEDCLSLKVLLIDDLPERAELVIKMLREQGCPVLCHLENPQDLAGHVARLCPDIVIIDMESPDRDTLESMAAMNRSHPRPVVFFAENETDSRTIQAAIKAGVSAYIADGINPDRVRPVLDAAIAQFEAFHSLRLELEQTRTQLADRKLIDRAKGMLMKHQDCDEDQAYRTLRKLAMDRGQKLGDVARDVIHVLQQQPTATQGVKS